MLKLKSLFRRGQAPAVPSASGGASGKQHSGSNNNRNKSQSTTSLNSAVENEQQQAAAAAAAAQFYAINPASERAVDVGDVQLNNIAATAEQLQSNTLPQPKKTKATKAKGIKQPKQLPTPKAATAAAAASNSSELQQQQQQQQQQQTVINSTAKAPATVAAGNAAANVMTTIAAAPVGQNSTLPTSHLAATAAANNNYTAETVVAPSPAAAALAYQDCNDLYKLNAAIAGNYQQYISSNNEQQQQLLEAKSKMQELQTQMERMGHEKLLLESRVAELLPYQHEVTKLKSELLKMQSQYEKSQMEIGHLKYENESLRNRLRDVVNSPLSDTEKHQIIQDSQRLHSSAPASIAAPSSTNVNSITTTNTSTSAAAENDACTPCLTPDWDKHSSSSEISVACLQDKIIQMEETHYSTNEELQATLQELADLQTQLADTQTENERLAEEKDVLFQSLCRQTEKLNETRTQINTLQELLLRDAKQAELGNSERENKLLELIKTSQEERENVLVKQEELNAELQELRQSVEVAGTENKRFRERIALLDSTLDAASAERKQTEAQLLQAKEEISQRAIEMSRLSTLLDNARSKIDELEQDLARGEKTDLSELLDAARKEKDALEERVAELQDQCSRSQAEIRRLKDQVSGLTEECKVAKNNAKCAVSHLEYRLEQLQHEKDKQSADYQQLVESTAELQVQSKCQQEDKTQLQKLLGKTQQQLGDMERKLQETQEQLDKETQLRKQEAEEWQQFQSDLLMTVRVANDFKTEALSAREQLVIDNKTAKDKIRLLEQQIEKLAKQQMHQTETQQSVLSSVQQEMASRRNKIGSSLNRQDSRLSVKTLIESIESNSNAQSAKAEETEESHYSSTSSLNSAHTPEITTNMLPPPFNNVGSNDITNEWSDHVRLSTAALSNSANAPATLSSSNAKGPLREQQQQQQQQTLVSNMHFNSLNNVSKPLLSGERKDPLNMLAKNGGSKRNALLKWCQNKTVGYRNIDITNFSSSWNDGLALSAILHSYLSDRIPYDTLSPANKRRNFSLAFAAAESVGIPTTLNINDMCQLERPDWTQVMTYVTAIYKHFET